MANQPLDKIGVEAVFEMAGFTQGVQQYNRGTQEATKNTNSLMQELQRLIDQEKKQEMAKAAQQTFNTMTKAQKEAFTQQNKSMVSWAQGMTQNMQKGQAAVQQTSQTTTQETGNMGSAFNTLLGKLGPVGQSVQNLWNSFSGGLKAGVIVAAVTAAVGTLAKELFAIGKEGAPIVQMERSFAALQKSAGLSATLLEEMRIKSDYTIGNTKLMASVTTLLAGASKELSTEMGNAIPQLLEIAKASNKLNPTLGDTGFMLDSIALGIKRGSKLILDNLGILVSQGDANEKYAKSVGKTVGQLTDEEMKIALLNAVLEQGTRIIQQAEGATGAMSDSYEQLDVAVTKIGNSFKKSVAEGIAPAVQGMSDALTWNERMLDKSILVIAKAGKESKTFAEYQAYLTTELAKNSHHIDENGNLVNTLTGNIEKEKAVLTETDFALQKYTRDMQKFGGSAQYASEQVERSAEEIANLDKVMREWKIDQANKALEQLAFAIEGNVGKAYDDYITKQGDLNDKIMEYRAGIAPLTNLKILNPQEVAQANKLWQALELVKKQVEGVEDLTGKERGALNGLWQSLGLAKKYGEGFATMTKTELNKVIKDLNAEILKITGGSFLTEEQKKQLEDLKTKLGDAEEQAAGLAREFEAANKKMVFSMLIQSLKDSGLDPDTLRAKTALLYDLAGASGMLSTKDAELGKAVANIDWRRLSPEDGQTILNNLLGIANGTNEITKANEKLMKYNRVKLLKGEITVDVPKGKSYSSLEEYYDILDKTSAKTKEFPANTTKQLEIEGRPYVVDGVVYESFEAFAGAVGSAAGAIKQLQNKSVTVTTTYESVYTNRSGRIGGDQTDFRASGGDVQMGRPYIIGENGPEFFIPSLSGFVLTKQDALSVFAGAVQGRGRPVAGGGTVVNNYNLGVTAMDAPQVVIRSFGMLKALS